LTLIELLVVIAIIAILLAIIIEVLIVVRIRDAQHYYDKYRYSLELHKTPIHSVRRDCTVYNMLC
jgi:prepilin-type N-terminal cleavage/methylation domain-containing protein